MSKICSNCGHENRDIASFCGNCGSELIANDLANNLTGGSSYTKTAANKGTANDAANNRVGANGSNDAGSLCCGVLIILFIIILIMSMG